MIVFSLIKKLKSLETTPLKSIITLKVLKNMLLLFMCIFILCHINILLIPHYLDLFKGKQLNVNICKEMQKKLWRPKICNRGNVILRKPDLQI